MPYGAMASAAGVLQVALGGPGGRAAAAVMLFVEAEGRREGALLLVWWRAWCMRVAVHAACIVPEVKRPARHAFVSLFRR